MNEKINLCEILKGAPTGTKLWHSIHGEVTFEHIDNDFIFPIRLKLCTETGTCSLAEDGHFKKGVGDCLLWPSKSCRDWSKWKCPKPKFDPKTLKAFDKILSRNVCDEKWTCDFVSYLSEGKNIYGDVRIYVIGVGNTHRYSIPYNEETKHLVGTTDEAPEYYRWED